MKLDLTIEQIGILDKALQQMPYGMVAKMIADINIQLAQQQKMMDTPVETEKKT